jgi:hypothetical protein
MQVYSQSMGVLIISHVNFPPGPSFEKKPVFHKDNIKHDICTLLFFSLLKLFFLPVAASQMAPVTVERVGNYFSSLCRFTEKKFSKVMNK